MPMMPIGGQAMPQSQPMGMGGRTPYPNSDEIMQEQSQQQVQGSDGGNPIMDALRTLQMYVVAKKEQGQTGPLQAFMQFIESLQGQQPQEAGGMPNEQIAPTSLANQAPTNVGPRAENAPRGTVLAQ